MLLFFSFSSTLGYWGAFIITFPKVCVCAIILLEIGENLKSFLQKARISF